MSIPALYQQRLTWSIMLSLFLLVILPACTLTTNNDDETTTLEGAPIVNIAAPADGTTYADGVAINVQAAISRAGEDIERVVIGVNGADVETVAAPNPTGLTDFSLARTIPSPGMGSHIISVTAFRTDGSGSQAATVNIDVVDGSLVVIPRSVSLDVEPETTPEPVVEEPVTEEPAVDEEPAPTEEQVTEPAVDEEPEPTEEEVTEPDPTAIPEPTDEPEPTNTPLPPTPSIPTAISTDNINVRSGPSVAFDPPIGAFREGDRAEILATNLDGTWLKIRRGASGEGWIFRNLVNIEGDLVGLPREAGPPLPPTAVPATAVPPTSAVTNNLVPINPFIDPPVPQCGQDFRTGITIRNDGSASGPTGQTLIEVIRVSDGQVLASSGMQPSVDLPAGGTHTIAVTFNIDVFINEEQRVRFTADANNQVTETIENDNQIGITYTLPPCN